MKNVWKSSLSIILAVAIIFSSAAVGLTELDLSGLFAVKGSAASVSDLVFEFDEYEKTYSVAGCNPSASGNIVIPSKYNGYPVKYIGPEAFYECAGLVSVEIPDSVTRIDWCAFYGCTSLESITIPNSVTTIDSYAFSDCTKLASIDIPESVITIYHGAFSDCTSLESITIPDGVKNIGEYTFSGCTSLTSVNLGNGVESIGRFAFYNCTSLVSVTLGDNLTSVTSQAFSGCTNIENVYITDIAAWCDISFGGGDANPLYYADNLYLNGELVTDLVIPDNVTSIGYLAFSRYPGLTSVTIPDGVTDIGASAFSGCSNLETVIIGDGVKTVGDFTFYDCANLTSVTIGKSVTSIGQQAFKGCTNIESVHIKDIAAWCGISCYDSYSNPMCYADNLYFNDDVITDLVIPDGVTTITDSAFKNCVNISSVVIPDTVTSIENSAFEGCSGLESAIIPNNVKSIGKRAFYKCTSLTSIAIPNSVTVIGDAAFSGCTSLASITIPDSVTKMGSNAFHDTVYFNDDSNWENGVLYIDNHLIKADASIAGDYRIKEGTKSIAGFAFDCCANLTSLYIPEGIINISGYTFYGCMDLTSIELPDSVTNIDEYAFNNCWSLTSVELPDGLTSIGVGAFSRCYSLASIVFPDGVVRIRQYAFKDCNNLKSITISESVEHISYEAFSGCTGLEKIYWNARCVQDFDGGSEVFYNAGINGSGIEVVFSDTVERIPQIAFDCSGNGPKITSVIIGENVTSIGEWAFCGCTNLVSISISGCVKYIGYRAFYDTAYYNDESNWENDVLYIDNHLINANTSIAGNYKIKDGTISIAERAFEFCENLISVEIPDGLICIGDEAFYQCENLASVSVPNSLTDIGEGAFDGCTNLISFTIPDGVTSINYGTFLDCLNLESVTIPDSVTSIGDSAFGNCHSVDIITSCDSYASTYFAEHMLKLIHNSSSRWIIDTPATVNYPGSKHRLCSVCGRTVYAEIPQLKPATPKVATENALTGVLVKWNAVTGATKYQVYRRQGGSNTWALVGTTTGTSLTDTKVSSGIYYVYSVRAYNNAGQYSDFVSANTQTRKYMAVPKLKGISNATNGLYITWNPVAGVTNGYRVYRRGAGSTYWTYLGTTKNTYFTDTQVKNNSGEYFRYTVIADGGYHSKFDTTGLYLRRLSNPTLKSAVSSKTGITVKWTPVKGCLGYYVYRKTANSGWVRIAVVNGANVSSYVDKTAKKGVTYTYTVRAVCGNVTSYFNSGISCKDKY